MYLDACLCLRSVSLMTATIAIRIVTDCLQLYKNSKSSVISHFTSDITQKYTLDYHWLEVKDVRQPIKRGSEHYCQTQVHLRFRSTSKYLAGINAIY